MKTLLLIALASAGIALCAPEAHARDHRHRSGCSDSYRSEYSHHGHSYYHGGYSRRGYYSSGYYVAAPRYYYRPSRSYYSSDRCYPERRHSFRPPLISFLFGF